MATVVYILCAVLSTGCAFMLYRGYRRRKHKILLWSTLSFMGLALNNIMFFVDVAVLPDVNMWGSLVRAIVGSLSGTILLYGFITELT